MYEPTINISPSFHGSLIIEDLLKTEATIVFDIDSISIKKGGLIFSIEYKKNFIFTLSFQNNSIVIHRNEIISTLELGEFLEKSNSLKIFIMWSPTTLILDCGVSAEDRKRAKVKTKAIATPVELIRWARKKHLLPTEVYLTEEDFRNKVYSILTSVNKKIYETNAFKSFWNIEYNGQKIISRKPKKEVELQPLIHCILSDILLINNIEVVPEYPTGAGSLDFLFIAQVQDIGMIKICIEFKLAHSQDLKHGLLNQLPAYMNASTAKYGAYCVLSFKGGWFDKPNIGNDRDLQFYVNRIGNGSENPIFNNIRTFIFDMAKPLTASKV